MREFSIASLLFENHFAWKSDCEQETLHIQNICDIVDLHI